MQAILQYWFAVLQQTSIFSRQKLALSYLKFSAEFNEFSLHFYNQQEVAEEMARTKIVQKNAYMQLSEAKG